MTISIERTRHITSSYKCEIGSYINNDWLISSTIESSLEENVYYGVVSSAEGLFLIETEYEISNKKLRVRKIFPNIIPSNTTRGQVNTADANVFISVNRGHIVVYLRSNSTATVLNINTGLVEYTVTVSNNSNYVRNVYYDHDYKMLIYSDYYRIYKHDLITNIVTVMWTSSGRKPLNTSYSSYVFQNYSLNMTYDSIRKKMAITYGYKASMTTTDTTQSSSTYYNVVNAAKIYSCDSKGILTDHSINASASLSEYRSVSVSGGYSTGSSFNYVNSDSSHNILPNNIYFDEKKGVLYHELLMNIQVYDVGYYMAGSQNLFRPYSVRTLVDYNNDAVNIHFTFDSGNMVNSSVGLKTLAGATCLYLGSNDSSHMILNTVGVWSYLDTSTYAYKTQMSSYNIQIFTKGASTFGVASRPFISSGNNRDGSSSNSMFFGEVDYYGRVILPRRTFASELLKTTIVSSVYVYDIDYMANGPDVYPVNGSNLESYKSENIKTQQAGNPLNSKLRSLGLKTSNVVYHDYFENLDRDIYLWFDDSNFVNTLMYYRKTDEVKNIKTQYLYDRINFTYDLGLCRDGSKLVLIKYNMTSPRSIEYYLSNSDFTDYQTAYYSHSSYTASAVKNTPSTWLASNHVLVTEIGVAGFSGSGDTKAFFVYHRSTDNYSMVQIKLSLNTDGTLNPSSCSVFTAYSSGTYRSLNPLNIVYIGNKYCTNLPVTADKILQNGETKTESVPVFSNNNLTASYANIIVEKGSDISGSYTHLTSYWNSSLSLAINKYNALRYIYITVGTTKYTLYVDTVDYSKTTYASFNHNPYYDIKFSHLKYLNDKKTEFILKGVIMNSIATKESYPFSKTELYFTFVVSGGMEKLYIGLTYDSNPFEFKSNKIDFTSLSSGDSVHRYTYLNPPILLNLDSIYPKQERFYINDNINVKLRVVDEDKTGATINSLGMSINGVEASNVLNPETETVDFAINIAELYETNKINDGSNSVQFRLDAGGDITFLEVPIYKGKTYKLDQVPELLPSTVITKGHIKAFNGEDEMVPVSGIKKQSSSGDVEYVYHYKKDYVSEIKDLLLNIQATKGDTDTVEIKKIIAVFEGGEE